MSADANVMGGPPGEVATSLHRGTDWRGAFVIGLAGVILVTGIVPFAVQAMGAAAIPAIIGIQVIAMAVCLCMGELAALYPHRTGGTPSYAYESFKPLGESAARHIGGVSGWSYWLGWFPVAPINMILASYYIAELFHVPQGRLVNPLGSLGTPTGIGVLHGRAELLEGMQPFLTGGDMIASVSFESATWNELPYKFEAGTPPIAEAVGLGAAVDYLGALDMERVRAHELALTAYMLERLAQVPGLRVVGPPTAERRGGLASFTIDGMHPHDVAELADRAGVCIRAGHHCAQPLMRCLGVSATARASVGVYNDRSDIDALVEALQRGREVFGL